MSLWIKSKSVIIQMKATEWYFPVVLFTMLYRVVLTLSLLVNSKSVTIQVKATEQHFNAMLVVLTFESVDEILNCDHSNRKATEQHFR